MLIKQNSSLVTGWTELWGYPTPTTNLYRFELPNNYLIQQQISTDAQYIFRYTTYYAGDSGYYNGFVIGGPGVSKFILSAYHSGYTERGYIDFVPYAEPFVMTITNRYPAAGRQTMLDLSVSVDVNLDSNSEMVFTFDTNNLLNNMFENDLEGDGTASRTYRYLDCREWNTLTEISNSRIVCLLYFGDRLANPPKPANLTIKFTTNFYGYSSSRTIRVLIANVKNPVLAGLNTGVRLSITNYCENQHNLPCSTYEARGYYVTSAAAENLVTTTASFTSSSSLVLTTGLTHTFTLSLTASITTTDVIYIIYP